MLVVLGNSLELALVRYTTLQRLEQSIGVLEQWGGDVVLLGYTDHSADNHLLWSASGSSFKEKVRLTSASIGRPISTSIRSDIR